ncbi:hypothetical protein AXK58_13760 [Tsukamurella tyrosinosolvens]|uniref:site-specific DNA-methyltransferase (adenine-specific) n=2 Tax=Tsukamurella tyrosinosolvens TaxID=57704 RepID=A0A1H4UGJ9_TSUTY|nr:hypothetical protein AXK58_13760 [Tsukamurella tyrosinosolvens]SEC67518.1 DNA adenine methylase [Tsukamurella tyrosinosolvens]
MAGALTGIWHSQFTFLDLAIWVEPFAGGAGAGLHLLETNVIEELWLVEKNPALAAFWRMAAHRGDELAAAVRALEPDMAQWHRAREIVAAAYEQESIDDASVALAALVLNRCSRSGMVNPRVGPIGGKNQTGRWTIRARWNADGIAERIERVYRRSDQIRVDEGDAITRIQELDGSVGIEDEVMLFVDPPYLVQGNGLYANGMSEQDHRDLAAALTGSAAHWILTYDADDRVPALYPAHRVLAYEIPNTANRQRIAEEYAVFSPFLDVQEDLHLLPKGSSRWVQRINEPAAA